MNKISLYWKCHLIGWASFVTISYVFNNIIYKDFIGFFYNHEHHSDNKQGHNITVKFKDEKK